MSSSSPNERRFEKWRKNLSWVTGLGLTPEEEEVRRHELDQKLDESLLRRCERMKRGLLENSACFFFFSLGAVGR